MLGKTISLGASKVAAVLEEHGIFQMVIENLYCMVLSNFGFTGQDVGLSMEAALRLLEFFIFECDSDYEHFIALITYMLLLC